MHAARPTARSFRALATSAQVRDFDKVGCDQPVLEWLPNPSTVRRSIASIYSAPRFVHAKFHLLLYRFPYHSHPYSMLARSPPYVPSEKNGKMESIAEYIVWSRW